jgi:hypothetical protein
MGCPSGEAAWPTLIEPPPPSCGEIKWQAKIVFCVDQIALCFALSATISTCSHVNS